MKVSCACVARFLISQHPEVEAKITTELEDLGFLVGPSRPVPRQMEYSDLSKLTYLSAAIKVANSPLRHTACSATVRLCFCSLIECPNEDHMVENWELQVEAATYPTLAACLQTHLASGRISMY